MNLLKHEYENIMALLNRVSVTGHAEAETLVTIGLKIKAKLASWVDAPIADINKGVAEVKADVAKVEAEVKKV